MELFEQQLPVVTKLLYNEKAIPVKSVIHIVIEYLRVRGVRVLTNYKGTRFTEYVVSHDSKAKTIRVYDHDDWGVFTYPRATDSKERPAPSFRTNYHILVSTGGLPSSLPQIALAGPGDVDFLQYPFRRIEKTVELQALRWQPPNAYLAHVLNDPVTHCIYMFGRNDNKWRVLRVDPRSDSVRVERNLVEGTRFVCWDRRTEHSRGWYAISYEYQLVYSSMSEDDDKDSKEPWKWTVVRSFEGMVFTAMDYVSRTDVLLLCTIWLGVPQIHAVDTRTRGFERIETDALNCTTNIKSMQISDDGQTAGILLSRVYGNDTPAIIQIISIPPFPKTRNPNHSFEKTDDKPKRP